jgi:hypothetical protein
MIDGFIIRFNGKRWSGGVIIDYLKEVYGFKHNESVELFKIHSKQFYDFHYERT